MNVLVLLPLTEAQRATLESGAPDAAYTYATKLDVTDEQIAAAEVIVGNLEPAPAFPRRAACRLLQLNSAGYDKYSAPGTVPEGAALTCAVGAYGQAVSEHMFAMILAMMKHLDGYRDDGRGHLWTDRGQVTTFAGAQVLVLGAGDIGTHFAKLAGSFGAHVTGVRRRVGKVPEGFDAIRSMDDLPELLPAADVVVWFLPSSPAARGLADAAFFARCKPGSYFANGGRGDLGGPGRPHRRAGIRADRRRRARRDDARAPARRPTVGHAQQSSSRRMWPASSTCRPSSPTSRPSPPTTSPACRPASPCATWWSCSPARARIAPT